MACTVLAPCSCKSPSAQRCWPQQCAPCSTAHRNPPSRPVKTMSSVPPTFDASEQPWQAPPPAPGAPGWFQRNWKWFIPALLLFIVLGVVAFVGGILALVFGSIQHSVPAQYALEAARKSPAVGARFGRPIKIG